MYGIVWANKTALFFLHFPDLRTFCLDNILDFKGIMLNTLSEAQQGLMMHNNLTIFRVHFIGPLFALQLDKPSLAALILSLETLALSLFKAVLEEGRGSRLPRRLKTFIATPFEPLYHKLYVASNASLLIFLNDHISFHAIIRSHAVKR